LDAFHVPGLQVRVIGNEEINAGSGSAGQLDGVRSTNRAVAPQSGIDFRRLDVKIGR
jgi:hypothetical protein